MNRAGIVGPFGPVALVESGGVLVGLEWRLPEVTGESALLTEGLAQLAAYFERRLVRFDLPMDWGTGLNAAVRRAMADIPLGETRTYGQIAKAVGAAPAGGGAGLRGESTADPDPLPSGDGDRLVRRVLRSGWGGDQGRASAARGGVVTVILTCLARPGCEE